MRDREVFLKMVPAAPARTTVRRFCVRIQGWATRRVRFSYPLHATERLKRLSTSSCICMIIPSRTTHESRHTLSTLMLHDRHCTRLRQRGECYDTVMRAATMATPAHMVDATSADGRHSTKLSAPGAL